MKSKKNCIVLDIDGVILNTTYLFREIMSQQFNSSTEKYNYFYKYCNSERTHVFPEALKLIKSLNNSTHVILSTARNILNKESTCNKLRVCSIKFNSIYMRETGDLRPSCEIKVSHVSKIMKDYNILYFIDDDLSNIRAISELGIPCFKPYFNI